MTDPYFEQIDEVARNLIFPQRLFGPGGETNYFGLTKRELFAAMAMQTIVKPSTHSVGYPFANNPADPYWSERARMAVAAADALLKELAK